MPIANHHAINHTSSSGAMESAGAVAIFHRSVDSYGLRYATYIGDGDTGSYPAVVESKPYADTVPGKLECVGHVQKRLGTRLRNLRIEYKGKVLSDGKKISGKGRLTDKAINTLQNYYGMAIRHNTGDLYGMKKAVAAVLFHCSESKDNETRHRYCPRTTDSWCKWQADRMNGNSTFKMRMGLPEAVKELLEPIFRELGSDELLGRCLHGKTQNPNESFNGILWQKCPKQTFVGRLILELAAFSAVIHYNDGFLGLISVFKELKIKIGPFFLTTAERKVRKRVAGCTKKSSEEGKLRRKKLRAIRKGHLDKEKEAEGDDSYSTGAH